MTPQAMLMLSPIDSCGILAKFEPECQCRGRRRTILFCIAHDRRPQSADVQAPPHHLRFHRRQTAHATRQAHQRQDRSLQYGERPHRSQQDGPKWTCPEVLNGSSHVLASRTLTLCQITVTTWKSIEPPPTRGLQWLTNLVDQWHRADKRVQRQAELRSCQPSLPRLGPLVPSLLGLCVCLANR